MSRFFHRLCVAALVLIPLCLIGFTIWRLILAHEVNTEFAAIRAAGLPTSGAELNAYYTAVPDNENAALVMTQAFALMWDFPDHRSKQVVDFKIPSRKQSLTSEQKNLLSTYLEKNAPALAKAGEAVKLPRSRYPVDLGPNEDALLPHLPKLRKISIVACFESLNALQAQDGKEAANLISFQFALCHTLDTEPLLISQVVRDEMISAASQLAENGLNQVSFDEANLSKLEKDFEKVDENGFSPIGFIGDRAMTLPYFQTNWLAIYRIISYNRRDLPFSIIFRGRFGWFTGLFDRDEVFYIEAMQAAVDEIRRPYPQCLFAYSTMYETALKGQNHGYILGPGALYGLRNALPKEVETISRVRIAMAALAVERFRLAHGQLPENLNEPVPQFLSRMPEDPYDGQPLRYDRLPKGYVIYSVGADGNDNGGREKPDNWKSSDQTEYDITFTVER